MMKLKLFIVLCAVLAEAFASAINVTNYPMTNHAALQHLILLSDIGARTNYNITFQDMLQEIIDAIPAGSGDVTQAGQNNFSGSNYFGGDVSFGGSVNINNANATSTLSNLNVTGWATVSGSQTNTAAQTNTVSIGAPYLYGTLHGDVVGNAATATSATTATSSSTNTGPLSASQLTGPLPPLNAAALTNLPAANLTGTLPVGVLPSSVVTNGGTVDSLNIGTLNLTNPLPLSAMPVEGLTTNIPFLSAAGITNLLCITNGLICAVSAPIASAALTNGMVAYWKLDETSGTRADSSGNGFTLSEHGTDGYAAGIAGNSISNTAASSLYLASSGDSLDIVGPITVVAWVKLAALPSALRPIVARASSSSFQWVLYIDSANKFNWLMETAASSTAQVIYSTPASTGSWVFLAARWDGTNMMLRVNGSNATPAAFAGPPQHISGFNIGDFNSFGYGFGNQIDEVGVWSRSLTDAELDSLYNSGSGKTYPFE